MASLSDSIPISLLKNLLIFHYCDWKILINSNSIPQVCQTSSTMSIWNRVWNGKNFLRMSSLVNLPVHRVNSVFRRLTTVWWGQCILYLIARSPLSTYNKHLMKHKLIRSANSRHLPMYKYNSSFPAFLSIALFLTIPRDERRNARKKLSHRMI